MSPMWTQSATPVQGPHAGVASGSLPWTTGPGVGLRDRRRRDHPQVTESWTAPELQPVKLASFAPAILAVGGCKSPSGPGLTGHLSSGRLRLGQGPGDPLQSSALQHHLSDLDAALEERPAGTTPCLSWAPGPRSGPSLQHRCPRVRLSGLGDGHGVVGVAWRT